MNRIQHIDEPSQVESFSPAELTGLIDFARFEASDPSCHTYFSPLHYEEGYGYPLLVWLHGPEDNEHQLKRVMPSVSLRNFVAVAPRGTYCENEEDTQAGFRWRQTPDDIQLAEQRVLSAVEQSCEKYNIQPSRVFLAGFRCGGTMALRIALSHPERFAGALTLGGPFPQGHCPLRRLDDARGLPLLLSCGAQSREYPETQVCQDLRLFHSAGLSVTLRQYPCADELTTLMLEDINRWMMEQIGSDGAIVDG